ncbi:MAG: adenylyltransferase/cytidyltransferase family protein [Minisyncoccia bacterium]
MPENEIKKTKLGLVVGRFQPLHDGHRYLIRMAIEENDIVVICIGSSQKADPLPVCERLRRVNEFLGSADRKNKEIKVIYLPDIESDERWPLYLKNGAGITDETKNIFYTGDDLDESYISSMEKIGFEIRTVERNIFEYTAPDGRIHALTCATEIRKIHRDLRVEVV